MSSLVINCMPIFTNILQPCVFFKLWKISEIISVAEFFLAEAGASSSQKKKSYSKQLFGNTYEGLQVYLKRITPRMSYWEVSKNFWSTNF